MDQGTKEWLSFRHKGIGSSDAPVIMGKSPYKTRLQLFKEKIMPPVLDEERTFVQNLGHLFESKALAHFALSNEIDDIRPEVFEHKNFSWIRASLDGYSAKKNMLCEIKYVGQKRFEQVMDTKQVLQDHEDQVQHQFLTTGASQGFYICYTLTSDKKQIKDIGWVRVDPDMSYIENTLFPAEQEFWACVESGKAPEPTEKDEAILDDSETSDLVRQYLKLSDEKKSIEANLKVYEEKLKNKAFETGRYKVRAFNLTLSTVVRKGNVDYGKIPALKGVDLEAYRKAPSCYMTIKKDT